MDTTKAESEALLDDYRKWVKAYLGLWRGKPSLAVEALAQELKVLEGSALAAQTSKPSSDVLRLWASRGSIPASSSVREALIRVIEKYAPNPVGLSRRDVSFRELLDRIHENRALTLFDSDIRVGIELHKANYLLAPVSNSKSLSLELLGLASELTGWRPPPFIQRDLSPRLLEALSSNQPFIAIRGPAKSGKTRLMAEAIRAEKSNSTPVFWLSESDDSISQLLKYQKQLVGSKRVIVLEGIDDFQLRQRSELANWDVFLSLLDLGQVVMLSRDSRQSGPRLGYPAHLPESLLPKDPRAAMQAGVSVSEYLSTMSFRLDVELSEAEFQRAKALLGDDFSSSELSRFSEFVSSGEILLEQYRGLESKNILGRSIAEAMIDCHICFNSGFSIKEFSLATELRLRLNSRSAPWSQALFESVLFELTTGVDPDSTLALLEIHSDELSTLSLPSGLWRLIAPQTWSIPHWSQLITDPFEAGRRAFNLQYFDLAALFFERHIETNDSDLEALGSLALSLKNSNKLEAAEQLLRRLVEESPDDIRGYEHLAEVLNSRSMRTEALRICERGLQVDPNSLDLGLQKASAHYESGQIEEALAVNDSLKCGEDLKWRVVLQKANFLGNLLQHAQSASLLESLPERNGDSCLVAESLAIAFLGTGRFEDLNLLISKHASHDFSRCQVGFALPEISIISGNVQEARASLIKLARRSPENLALLNRIARFLFELGEWGECLRILSRIAERTELHPEQIFISGMCQYKLQNFEAAEASFEMGLVRRPRDHHAVAWLGNVHMARSQWAKARECYRQAGDLSRKNSYLLGEAAALDELGEHKLAERLLKDIQDPFTSDLTVSERDSFVGLFLNSLLKNNKRSEAIEFGKQQLQANPSLKVAELMVQVLNGFGMGKEADSLISWTLERHSDLVWPTVLKARYLMFRKEWGDARSFISESIRKWPADSTLRLLWADSEVRLKNFSSARTILSDFDFNGTSDWTRATAMLIALGSRIGLVDQAETQIREFIEQVGFARGNSWLSLSFLKVNLSDSAVGFAQDAYATNRDDQTLVENLGYILDQAGRPKEAVEVLAEFAERHKGSYRAEELMAQVLKNAEEFSSSSRVRQNPSKPGVEPSIQMPQSKKRPSTAIAANYSLK